MAKELKYLIPEVTSRVFRVEHQYKGDVAWWHSPGTDEVTTRSKARKLMQKHVRENSKRTRPPANKFRITEIQRIETVIEYKDL